MTTMQGYLGGMIRGARTGGREAARQARANRTVASVAAARRLALTIERVVLRAVTVAGLVVAAWMIYHPAAFVVVSVGALWIEALREADKAP